MTRRFTQIPNIILWSSHIFLGFRHKAYTINSVPKHTREPEKELQNEILDRATRIRSARMRMESFTNRIQQNRPSQVKTFTWRICSRIKCYWTPCSALAKHPTTRQAPTVVSCLSSDECVCKHTGIVIFTNNPHSNPRSKKQKWPLDKPLAWNALRYRYANAVKCA